MKAAALSCLLLPIATTATAEPITFGAIQVLDGDTVATGAGLDLALVPCARRRKERKPAIMGEPAES
jgi:hypothetical protein